ncbi:hypothetical protein HMF8227_01047 [Saliniradius amylolyticus]|uniref:Yip1 domain-containing protein n=1 Tax=Saliniradius amylolyticus TaxID=2183582 RepID=A0A2S2E1K5_9ALTE|nr:Yip1 family protein [Saliniradius amylolyticus]AWL11535.1 hypothetical protein HMF8227_01047 [Saliniradius amylolyticus]
MEKVNNPLQACKDIIFKPNHVFATLEDAKNWSWVPFILVVLCAALPNYLYFETVDFQWYKEMMVNAQMSDVSPAEKEAARQQLEQSHQFMGMGFSVLMTTIGFIIVNAIVAAYLNLTTRNDEYSTNGFTDWYGFAWWVSIPAALAGLVSALVILLFGSEQMLPSIMAATSVGYWLSIPVESDWFGFGQALTLESLWMIYLLAVGISQWTRLPSKTIWMIAALPFAVIWGGWLLVLLF